MKIMLPCQQKNASMAVLPDGLHSCFSVTSCAEIAAHGASCLFNGISLDRAHLSLSESGLVLVDFNPDF